MLTMFLAKFAFQWSSCLVFSLELLMAVIFFDWLPAISSAIFFNGSFWLPSNRIVAATLSFLLSSHLWSVHWVSVEAEQREQCDMFLFMVLAHVTAHPLAQVWRNTSQAIDGSTIGLLPPQEALLPHLLSVWIGRYLGDI